jgi:spore maturation protein CgeB
LRVVIFSHSLISDWNHGNAHFLRGIAAELLARGHDLRCYEPADSWSRSHLDAAAVASFHRAFPDLHPLIYAPDLDLAGAIDGAGLVLVHEWNDPALVAGLGRLRARSHSFRLFFHDTHHRSVTAPEQMATYDLRDYDGVLAFGSVIRELYIHRGWAARAWTWHEAADVRRFQPPARDRAQRDLVWIGNWGDGERTAELQQFLLLPVRDLGLSATVHGVRYPPEGLEQLGSARIDYRGWLPNHRVPEVFAEHRVTVHVPRRPYAQALPGVPTIRVFEALACGIPLVCAPWEDSERLFRRGEDFLPARTGAEMTELLYEVVNDRELASSLARSGLETIRERHTCAHRVDELFAILAELEGGTALSA